MIDAVPLVVVVGKNGGLVDYQMGFAPDDRERLIAAVQLARRIGPLADPDEAERIRGYDGSE